MFNPNRFRAILACAIFLLAAIYSLTTGYFGRELIVEAAILAILAISLDLAAGYGGMVSLCHGAIFGLGAYAYAVLTIWFAWPGGAAILGAIATGAIFAFIIGLVSAKIQGIFFIMATLAFGQMAYVFIFTNRSLGGDDGMAGIARMDLSFLGIDLGNSNQFALFVILLAAICYWATGCLLRSAFGRYFVAIRSNEARIRAMGLSLWKYKAMGFAFSGMLAGFAGAILAQHIMFVSPDLLFWTTSGEILIIVILGGFGTLLGPVLGAGLFVFAKHYLGEILQYWDLPQYWHLPLGVILIAVVLSGGRGVYGLLENMQTKWREKRNA